MAVGNPTPNTANYRIGKGKIYFKRATPLPADTDFRHLGNAPSVIYTPTVTKKEHFTSMEGIKKKDATYITQVGATVKIKLEEIVGENVGLFVGSVATLVSDGAVELDALSATNISGTLKIEGTNEVGAQIDFVALVSFTPTGDFQFVTENDDFSSMEIDAEVEKDANGNYGVWTVREATPV